jgi:hypothetical protein
MGFRITADYEGTAYNHLGVGRVRLAANLLQELIAPSMTDTLDQSDMPRQIFLLEFLEGQSERQSWAHN